MTTPAQKPPGAGGGSVAIRGFLVQTLVALLDLVQADPPVTEITLEPALGDEQFDFVWKDSTGTHATQVKSTTNLFKKPDVEEWARKLGGCTHGYSQHRPRPPHPGPRCALPSILTSDF